MSVYGPQIPRHASAASTSSSSSPFRRAYAINSQRKPPTSSAASTIAASMSTASASHTRPNSSTSSNSATHHSSHHDSYYGHEDTAKTCAHFVSYTFNCPEQLPPPAQSSSSASAAAAAPPPNVPATLAHFVAYALHRTRLDGSVTFTALALLHRLKTRFPAARGSSGHRLFLSAFMIASKVVCDDTYSNKSWAVVGQGLFALREINQMEREMCSYLEWQLNVPREDLEKFEREVRQKFRREGPWKEGIVMILNFGVGGPNASTIPGVVGGSSMLISTTPLRASSISTPVQAEKEDVQQLPTPTEMGVTQMPFSRSSTASVKPNPGPAVPAQQVVQLQMPIPRVKAPYPSPPTTPPSPSMLSSRSSRASLSSRASQSTVTEAPGVPIVPAMPAHRVQQQQQQLSVSSGSDDSGSDSDLDEDEQDRALTDSPSPTSTDSSALPTPPNAKSISSASAAAYALAHGHHSHHHSNGGYGGLVKSFSMPPIQVHTALVQSQGGVPRSQTMHASSDAFAHGMAHSYSHPPSSSSAAHHGGAPMVGSVQVGPAAAGLGAIGGWPMEAEFVGDDEKRGVSYHATYALEKSAYEKPAPTARKEKKDGLKAYTVPCMW